MVTRWGFRQYDRLEIMPDGDWIDLNDYQALQIALREALDGWVHWLAYTPAAQSEWERVKELRKQFLDI